MRIPYQVRTTFDRSEPLNAHIVRRLRTALHPYIHYIDRVDVRLSDANGPRLGPADKVTLLDITLKPRGSVVARAAANDLYASVSRAAHRARSAVSRHVRRLQLRPRARRRGRA